MGGIWLLWSIPLAGVSLVLLVITIVKLAKRIGGKEILRASLVGDQVIDLPDTGEMQLNLHGPRGDAAFRGIGFSLKNTTSDETVPMSRCFPLNSYNPSRIRLAHSKLSIKHSGRYSLRISGLQSSRDYSRCRVLFTRPYAFYAVLSILGLVLFGCAFVGGLVMSIIYIGSG